MPVLDASILDDPSEDLGRLRALLGNPRFRSAQPRWQRPATPTVAIRVPAYASLTPSPSFVLPEETCRGDLPRVRSLSS